MLLVAATPARADDVQPWAVGVSDAQKAKAQELLDAGNAHFFAREYAAALDKYREAVAVWNHPAIRFNIVQCLIQLERTVEAWDNLVVALAYGPAPFDDSVYREALSYQKLLANQIADVEVSCSQPGVHLTFDGQPLVDCPGKQSRRTTPGQHQIVGTRHGFMTKTVQVVLFGGKQRRLDISLLSLDMATTIERRWPRWVPWLVLGSGITIAGLGALLELQSISDMNTYDHGIEISCTASCRLDSPSVDRDLYDRSRIENKVAIGVMVGGLTAATIGGVILYMNRGQQVYGSSVETIVDVEINHGGATVGFGSRF